LSSFVSFAFFGIPSFQIPCTNKRNQIVEFAASKALKQDSCWHNIKVNPIGSFPFLFFPFVSFLHKTIRQNKQMVRTTKAAAMPFTLAPTNTNSNTSATPVPTKLPVEAAPVAKKSKTTATTTAATTAATPAPVVAPIVATPTPASAPVVAVAEASATTIAVVVENVSIAALTAELNKINAQILALVNESKVLTKKIEKQNAKDIKAAAKSKPVRKVNANRQPSGFVKPTIISDELAAFLGRASGTLMSRTEVSKAINEYIKNNNLQLQSNKQHITPDAKLKTLLSIGPDDQLTYFNLQRYLKNHFQKSIADVATATTTTVAAAAAAR